MDYLLSRESSYYYEQSSNKRGRSYCFKGSIKQCILLYGEKTKIHFCLTFDVALLSIQEESHRFIRWLFKFQVKHNNEPFCHSSIKWGRF